jgi:hypothetical protein
MIDARDEDEVQPWTTSGDGGGGDRGRGDARTGGRLGLAGLTGTPSAVRLARQVLAHESRLAAVLWLEHSGVYDCPRSGSYRSTGPGDRPPSRACRPAAVRLAQNLRNGIIVSQLSTVTAPGLATKVELIDRSGNWLRDGARSCWQRLGAGQSTLPAFSYSGESSPTGAALS